MGKTRYVFFSPVSDRDPASVDRDDPSRYREGPMLHIARHYHPEKVCLYLTDRFREYEEKDHRFTKLLRYVLPELSEKDISQEYCPAEINPANFEALDDRFADILNRLHRDNPSCTLLLNLSSGTPQMQASLYLAAATASFPVLPMQVLTPAKGSNAKEQAFDVEMAMNGFLGEADETDRESAENRCKEVLPQKARRTILKESIGKLVQNYDYAAARTLYWDNHLLFVPKVGTLLNTAIAHLTVDSEKLQNIGRQGEAYYEQPDKINTQQARQCYDYLLYLGTLISRRAYGDFCRAFSPALTTVMELRLRQADYSLDPFCQMDSRGVKTMKPERVQKYDPAFARYLSVQYHGKFAEGVLKAAYFVDYLSYLYREKGVDTIGRANFVILRKAEADVRNVAAHEMKCITADEIVRATGRKAEDLLKILRQEYQCAMGVASLRWNGLENLNDQIIREMEKLP